MWNLLGVEDQPSESERYGDLESGPALYGVIKRKRDNDMDLHSNKQVSYLWNLVRFNSCKPTYFSCRESWYYLLCNWWS